MAGVLLEAGIVFAALALVSGIALRVRQSVIPAYIVAGILLGPYSPLQPLAIIETREFIVLLQELGIVFLLFFIGLEFNLQQLLASRQRVLQAGSLDVGVNAAVGVAVGLLLGFSAFDSLLLAGIVAISSSAVITKSLIDLGWIADPEAETVLGLLVFEDVVVAFYLAVLTALAYGGGTTSILTSLAISGLFIAALVLLAFYGTPLVERLLDVDSDEAFLLRVVGATVLVGGVALTLGVSEAVAAFFVGAAFGSSSHAHRIEDVITSERDLYAAVFFFAIGLQTQLGAVAAVALPLALLVVASTASKLVTGYFGGRIYGLDERRSVRVAVAMVARGEFSLVIAALAVQAGGSTQIVALAVGYVLVMSILGTLLMRNAAPFQRLVSRGEAPA